MKRKIWNDIYRMAAAISMVCVALLLSACGEQRELHNMGAGIVDDKRAVLWEGRVYIPFCVVSKSDCGEWIGYVNGDTDDRISEYRDYPAEEWIVSWMPMDGGAMLLKEESVTDIPDGLEAEY